MSPKKSLTESQAESDDNSEEQLEATGKIKRLLTWRSHSFNACIASQKENATRTRNFSTAFNCLNAMYDILSSILGVSPRGHSF